MTTSAASRQQHLLNRARRQLTERITAGERAAHDGLVAANQRRHGHGQELADRMHAPDAAARDVETAERPGWHAFVLAAVVAAAFLAAVEGAQHDGTWNLPILLGGALIVGLLVWAGRSGITRRQQRSSRVDREVAATLSPTIGCGVDDCGREPCATYRRRE